jgi:hypothetical protein
MTAGLFNVITAEEELELLELELLELGDGTNFAAY